MFLANPIWLWALAGLAIPLGIHLLSRKEGKIIRIGSLRHLQETNTQQFKGIRLNELVLLALRCALVTLFVLMMCGLSFEKEREAETKWLLIEKGLERLPQIQSQLDTFQNAGYELRWLSEGFPLYDDSASVDSNNLYWRLVEQLQTEKADDMIVISRNSINNFEGKRSELPANIRWMSVPVDAADFTLKAATDGDSVVVREGHSDADKTYFTTQRFLSKEWVSPNKPDTMAPIEIALVADDFYRNDQRIVEASLRALRSLGPIHVTKLKDINSSHLGNWCMWLNRQPVPDSIETNVMYLEPKGNSEIIIHTKSNRWIITKRLNEEIALNESLTVKLAALLFSSNKDWDLASQNDKRMLSDESAWSKNDSGRAMSSSLVVQSADSYLLMLFLLILLVERTLAYYRNQ